MNDLGLGANKRAEDGSRIGGARVVRAEQRTVDQHTLVIILQARNEVCLVARLLKAALLKQLLEVRDL